MPPKSAQMCATGGVKLLFGQCPNIHGFSWHGAPLNASVALPLALWHWGNVKFTFLWSSNDSNRMNIGEHQMNFLTLKILALGRLSTQSVSFDNERILAWA